MNDKALEILNNTGFPFQHYCANAISTIGGYQVSVEVPYTDPATNGPLLGVHGQIDILAVSPNSTGDSIVCFIIECKRANEKIKNWILLPNKNQAPKWPTMMFSEERLGQLLQLSVVRNVKLPGLGYERGSDFDYCINGIELNTHRQAINRDPAEKIFKPLSQVAHGSHAFEMMYPKAVEGIDYFRDDSYPKRIFIPVILTTANLYVADFAPNDVKDGDILDGGLDLGDARRWLTYEFPLPDYQGYTITRQDGMVLSVGKRTTFIVNHKHLDEFFRKASEVVVSTDPPIKI